MSVDESVSVWIAGLRQGDERAAQQLWQRYFQQLVRLAGRKLPGNVKREFDEEDIALSAFHSLCAGVTHGRFPELNDRDNLWSLLVVITARKAQHRIRDMLAQKRGGGQVRGESVFAGNGTTAERVGIDQVIGAEPTPEFALQVAEESELLLTFLEDDSLRAIARLKLEGYTNREVAEKLGCGLRTVGRGLGLIRKLWMVRCEGEGDYS